MVGLKPRELWELTDHVCRACYGRVLRADAGDDAPMGVHRFRCSDCGAEVSARTELALCACGQRLKTGRDAGIRCERNTPTAEFQSEVVAAQVDDAVLTSSQSVKHRFTNGGAPLFETSA